MPDRLPSDAALEVLAAEEQLSERAIPKNYTRRNVGSSPKSVLLGLYTKRGLGIGKETWRWVPLLCGIHELASRRPHPHCEHGYVSVMVNANASLSRHRDEYNLGLNYIYALPTRGRGGELWLSKDADDGPPRIHPPGEFELDRDWLVTASLEHGLDGTELRSATAAQA
eukprot:6490624-Amphidinium_carterae.1